MQADTNSKKSNDIDEVGLGKILSDARRAAGLTQQELCNKANLSYSTLAKIERGAIKAPSVFTITNIAVALDTTLDSLMGLNSAPSQGKIRSKRGIRFVYFDINGCLVRFYHQAFSDIAQDKKVSIDEVQTAFWGRNGAVCKGQMSLDQLNRQMAEDLGVDSLDWRHYYMQAAEPIAESHQLVEWSSQHYFVGLLSNIMPGFMNEMIASGLVPDIRYDAIIDSSVEGAVKPEAKIYDIAEEKSRCKSSEILFIDDSRANLTAASDKGWHVLWFDPNSPGESVANARQALEPANSPGLI